MKQAPVIRRTYARAFTRKRNSQGDAAAFRWLAGCILGLFLPAGVLAGYGSSSIQSPVPSPTRPPSSYRSGLIRTPDSGSTAGNLVVTGNVGGTRQLRAPVPYQAPTRFQGRLGSTSLDSFLRGSANPHTYGSAAHPNAFYSPTGTVSKMNGGRASGWRVDDSAAPMRVDTQATSMDQTEVVQPQVVGPQTSSVRDWRMWDPVGNRSASRFSANMWNALSPSRAQPPTAPRPSQQTEAAIPNRDDPQVREGPGRRVPASTNTAPQRTGDTDLGVSDTGQLFERLDNLRHGSAEASGRAYPYPLAPSADGQPQGVAPAAPPRVSLPDGLPGSNERPGADDARRDSLTVRDLQAALNRRTGPPELDARNRLDNAFLPPHAEVTKRESARDSGTVPALQRVQETARRFDVPSELLRRPSNDRSSAINRAHRSTDRYAPAAAPLEGRVSPPPERFLTTSGRRLGAAPAGPEDQNATRDAAPELMGDRILRKYKRHSTVSTNDFERHLHAARGYMRQGRYYRAAESFTRASVYRPGDALPHLGKSLALFAAGEYVSSSLLLARAIELNPQCAVAQADLVGAAGGPATFEYRLADLEQCLERSDAPQLKFLLAYVYHQIGRPQEAAQAAVAAQKGMPSSMVVDILKAAVAP